jgi:PAS domain S-box-containing protein
VAADAFAIVLCDDVPELRELTRLGLEREARLTVVGEAGDVDQCCELVRATRPDAVLLDLSLPGIDGLEGIPLLRKISPDLAIVIFSGFEATRMSPVALERGADDYVEKGRPLAEIQDALLNACAARTGRELSVGGDDGEHDARDVESPASEPAAVAMAAGGDARYKVLASRVPVGIYETDVEGRCTFVNQRWSEIAGIPWDEALGTGWTRAIHPDDRRSVETAWAAAVAAGRQFAQEFRMRRPDGEVRWVWSEAVAITAEERGETGFIGTLADVTERHDADERVLRTRAELEQRAAELERSNRDLEQFAYVASHDLSEPLLVIRGFIQMLAESHDEQLGDEGKRYIASALSGVERLQTLIDDLLDYSRVGRAALVKLECDSGQLAREASELVSVNGVSGAERVTVGELPRVLVEPQMMRRLFRNLMSNAIKFSPPGESVVVTAAQEDADWRFAIADHGPGIPPEQGERVFEMFQRLHGRDVPGTGIGLAICKRIVERHGGRIWHEPNPGGGTVFAFTIPRAEDG